MVLVESEFLHSDWLTGGVHETISEGKNSGSNQPVPRETSMINVTHCECTLNCIEQLIGSIDRLPKGDVWQVISEGKNSGSIQPVPRETSIT